MVDAHGRALAGLDVEALAVGGIRVRGDLVDDGLLRLALRHRRARQRVTVACGGHPLPFLVRADGSVDTCGRAGTLLGCFPEPALHEEVLDMHPGDAVVLYTDGVTEARKGSNVMGEAGLRAALVRAAGGSASEIADAIEQAALDFQDGDARDDIAIVVLKIPPAS